MRDVNGRVSALLLSYVLLVGCDDKAAQPDAGDGAPPASATAARDPKAAIAALRAKVNASPAIPSRCAGPVDFASTLCGPTAICSTDGRLLAIDSEGSPEQNGPCLEAVRRIEGLAVRDPRHEARVAELAAKSSPPPAFGDALACKRPSLGAQQAATSTILRALREPRLASCREIGDFQCDADVRRAIERMRIKVSFGCVDEKANAFLADATSLPQQPETWHAEFTYYTGVWRVAAGVPSELVGTTDDDGVSAGDLTGDGVPEALKLVRRSVDGGANWQWLALSASWRDPMVVLEGQDDGPAGPPPAVYAVATTEGALLIVQGEIRVWRDGRFVAAEPTAFGSLRAALAALPHGDYAAALRTIREPPAGWDAARDPCSDPERARVGKALLAKLSPDDPERLSTVNEMLGLLMCSTSLRPD